MPPNRRQVRVLLIACLVVLLGLGAGVVWFYYGSLTLRVATGTMADSGQKFVAAFMRTLADEQPRVHLKVIQIAEPNARLKALAAGDVDLAVVRSDLLTDGQAQTVAILRRDVVALMVPAQSPIETVGQLAGKPLGLVQGAESLDRILEQLLTYYQIPADKVPRVVLTPSEIGPALRQKRIAAVLAVGPPGPGLLTEVMSAVAKASKGPPELLEIEAAAAIAQRFPALEEAEIAPGALGATPPRPAESVTTLAVTQRFVARASLPNYAAGEFARVLFKTKAKLVATLPQAGAIEAPDTDKGAALPVHPGAAAYFDGEQTSLLEHFETYFYLGMIVLSLCGSGYAWLRRTWRRAGMRHTQEDMQRRLLAIMQEAPTVSPERLDALDQDVDEICTVALQHITAETMDAEQFQVFAGMVTQVRQALDKRRALLQ
jgi:TRAP transporter TAXI family solute receptor